MANKIDFSLKEVRKAFLLVSLTILIGIFGYIIIEGFTVLESLYMTVLTMSTVGFMEVKPLSDSGRIFTIFLIVSSFSAFAYFLSIITRYILDGEFIIQYKIHKMEQKILELNGHVIICGFGRNGREAADVLVKSGFSVVVIEEKILKLEATDKRIMFLEADATKDEIFIKCNIKNAKSLITTLPNDADNVYVVLAAREINSTINIISRASNDSSIKKLRTAGANNIIMPEKLGGAQMATLVVSPDIKELLDIMSVKNNDDFNIKEFELSKDVCFANLNVNSTIGATILAFRDKNLSYILNPDLSITCLKGNKVIVMGSKSQLQDFLKII